MSVDRSTLGAQVVTLLGSEHSGRAKGIHAKHLGAKLGIHDEAGLRVLRKAISEMREMGVPIAGMPETGYFIAATADELDEFCIKFLESRALHSLKLSSRLRNIPLPVLCGQLLLNQA